VLYAEHYTQTYEYLDQPEFQSKLQDICSYCLLNQWQHKLALAFIVHLIIIGTMWLIIGSEKSMFKKNAKQKQI